MTAHRCVKFSVGLLTCLTVCPAASAQPQPEKISTSGTLKGAAQGLLFVVSDQGDQFRVKIPAKPDYITFIGSADPSWLQAGMFATFVGKFDKKGNPVAPIRSLEVITPTKETPIGVFADTGLGGAADDLFSSEEDTRPSPEGVSYRVTGRITNVRDDKLTVQAGRVPVRVEIADSAKISVNVHDLRFISQGDKVSIEGHFLPQQRRNIVATRLTVSAAETLGAAQGEK